MIVKRTDEEVRAYRDGFCAGAKMVLGDVGKLTSATSKEIEGLRLTVKEITRIMEEAA